MYCGMYNMDECMKISSQFLKDFPTLSKVQDGLISSLRRPMSYIYIHIMCIYILFMCINIYACICIYICISLSIYIYVYESKQSQDPLWIVDRIMIRAGVLGCLSAIQNPLSRIIRQDAEVCPDSQRASRQAKMTMMTMMTIMMMMMIIIIKMVMVMEIPMMMLISS